MGSRGVRRGLCNCIAHLSSPEAESVEAPFVPGGFALIGVLQGQFYQWAYKYDNAGYDYKIEYRFYKICIHTDMYICIHYGSFNDHILSTPAWLYS